MLLVPHKNLHESAIMMHNVPSLVDKLSKMQVNSYAKLPILLIHLGYVWCLPKIPVSKFKSNFCPSNDVSYFTRSAHSTSLHSFVCDVRNNSQAMLTFFNLQSPEPDLSQSHQNVGHCPKNFVINPLLFFSTGTSLKSQFSVSKAKKSFSTTFSYFQSWNIHFSCLLWCPSISLQFHSGS